MYPFPQRGLIIYTGDLDGITVKGKDLYFSVSFWVSLKSGLKSLWILYILVTCLCQIAYFPPLTNCYHPITNKKNSVDLSWRPCVLIEQNYERGFSLGIIICESGVAFNPFVVIILVPVSICFPNCW